MRCLQTYSTKDCCCCFNYKFIYFNWRLITLQYCIGFAIHQHESATGIHVFPFLNPSPTPSPFHPSGSSQGTSPKHPVSCIIPGLAIHFIYDIIHVSMPFSQIIPPSPSPTESKRLFLLSHVRLFCNPMDHSFPGSSVHGISQARILEWVGISFSRASS